MTIPNVPPAKCAHRDPRGFTLLEMLLVLAILVAITAVTIPVVQRMYDTHRIRHAALEVRTALSAARLRAVDGGEAVECRFEPGGRHLVVLASSNRGHRFGNDPDAELASQPRLAAGIQLELPETLSFWTADASRDRLPGHAIEALGDGGLSEIVWSAPVVFTPNGRSTNAAFEIRDDSGRAVQFDVRGLTGAARASKLVNWSDR